MARFVVFKSPNNKQFYWHLKGDNNEILAQSEGYVTRYGAKRGAKRFAKLAVNAEIHVKVSK